ncbi:MAG: hypothetical protein Fur0032_08920 [Terrimicrobiaceae bacterium]
MKPIPLSLPQFAKQHLTAKRILLAVFWGTIVLALSAAKAQSGAPSSFMGMGLDGVNYWSGTPFANAAMTGSNWIEFSGSDWGTTVYTWDNPQFDPQTRLPLYLNAGKSLRMLIYPMNANYSNRPASWPQRSSAGIGRVLVTWTGDADIRLNSGSLDAGASNGAATGSLVNGRRTYQVSGPVASLWIEVHAVNPSNPPTSLKVWLPDPTNPTGQTLEGQFWHPVFLERLRDMPLRFLRFMDWGQTNGSPQVVWGDRRLPSHVTQTGTLNRRPPADGFSGNRPTGVAYEYMVMLANEIGTDLWVCVPHLADDTYIRKLARLIRFGSDGIEPYSAPQASPVFPPLRSDLKVWVEYSNEIWSSGSSFPQGNWAQQQANAQGITRPIFNARQFCRVWRLFQDEFGGTSRLVRVAALFTANTDYNQQFLQEIASYGPTLTPQVTADVASPTTYFGNGIQDWAHQRAQQQAGTIDPWFYTTSTFTSGSSTRPVTIEMSSSYWNGTALTRHLGETFAEWKRRIFSGSSAQGGGPDATGTGGGFDAGLAQLVTTALGRSVPLVSYEGGPSIYTDYLDGSDSRDDGITAFMEALNRAPGMAEMLRIQLNMAFSKGLRNHGIFVGPAGSWGKFGQWGQIEFMDQAPATSPRWTELLALRQDFADLRPVDSPQGSVPEFVTPSRLPSGRIGLAYNQSVFTTGGNGARLLKVIGTQLSSGLSLNVSSDSFTISGMPGEGGENFVYARVQDADGDAAWRIFSFYVGGGAGVVLESNFEGTNPALNLPWSATHQVETGWSTTGWSAGSGITPATGNDTLSWSQVMPSDEASSTLAAALAANSTWTISLTPGTGAQPLDLRGAEVRFAINRVGFHAPRRYALFTSATGLADGQQVFVTPRISSTGTTEQFTVTLPQVPALASISGTISFRLVGYSGQFSGHVTRLVSFRVRIGSSGGNSAPQLVSNPATLTDAYPGSAYSASLAALAYDPGDTLSWSKLSGPAWLTVASNGNVSGTPASGDVGTNTFVARVTDSANQSADLTFLVPVTEQAAAPVFSLPPGTYIQGVTVQLSTTTPGASIRYTMNGADPTATSGTVYSGPITLPSGSVTLRAVAYRSGLATSSVAIASYEITTPTAPSVLAHPQDQTVYAGANVNFEVQAEGSEPLSYQWRRNGNPLAGQTNRVLSLSNVTTSQSGNYDCVVSNDVGAVTSQAAVLQVLTSGAPSRPILSMPRPSFDVMIPTFSMHSFLLPLENLGGQPLIWTTAAAANGGTTNYYHFITQQPTAAGELDFNWRDIVGPSGGGTEITAALTSNPTVNVTLPWTFQFYGSDKTTVRVSRFGTLQFSADAVDGTNRSTPSTSAPADLIAVLWDDWRMDASSSVWWKSLGDEFIVTWKDLHHVNSTATRATFQAILFKDYRLRFQYLNTPVGGFSATVGLQNATKTTGVTVSHSIAANTTNGTAITLGRRMNQLHSYTTWNTNSTLNPLSAAEQILTINLGGLPSGSKWTTYVRVTTNDPDRPLEIVPVTFRVGTTAMLRVFGRAGGTVDLEQIYNGTREARLSNGTRFTEAGQVYTFNARANGNVDAQFLGNPHVQITGPNSEDFVLFSDLPGTIPMGFSSPFQIRFEPQGTGVRRALVRIESNSAEPVYTFPIEGPGLDPLEYWRMQFSLPSTGIGALDADPDGDGQINFLEYALGGHPLNNDAAAIAPRVEWVEGLLGITFRQQPDPTLLYQVQYSEDLLNWQLIWGGAGPNGQGILTTITEPEPPSSAPQKFLRLQIQR